MITISDTHHISIDGKGAGHVIDAVRNNPLEAADIKAAFDLWFIAYDETNRASIKQKEDGHAIALSEKDAAIAKLSVQIDALSGTSPALKAARDRRRAEIQKQVDALSRDLSLIDEVEL